MAYRAPTRCTQCHRLATAKGRCDQHQPKPWENPSANTRQLTSRQRHRFRAAVLKHYGPTCNHPGCDHPATEADHIIPISQGGAPDDWEHNGQALCRHHHEEKTRAETARANKHRHRGRH